MIKKFHFSLKTSHTEMSKCPNGFIGKFYHILKEEIISILYKLSQKGKEHFSTGSMRPALP